MVESAGSLVMWIPTGGAEGVVVTRAQVSLTVCGRVVVTEQVHRRLSPPCRNTRANLAYCIAWQDG